MNLLNRIAKPLLGTIFLLGALTADACTSAIISGKLTPDGRPLMWKNRDTSNLNNCVRHFKGEKYEYVAVVGYSAKPQSVWMGTNETGFSIMNTLSYNLSKEGERKSGRNGSVMRRALEICGDIDDFRNYLDTLPRPMLVEANYGIIDAKGNGAYFEVDNHGYTEFNIDNPVHAPHGYLVRSNFSVSGDLNEGAGYVRYQHAEQTLFNATVSKTITPRWIFDNLSRSFENPLMGIDLKSGGFNRPETNGWFVEQDFIARRSSSCATVVHGVKDGENPLHTTMWTVIGYPPVTPAIPVWVKGSDKQLPRLLSETSNGVKRSPLCDGASQLRNKIYSYNRGKGTETYFNWELLFNKQNNGFMQLNSLIEDELFSQTEVEIESIRSNEEPDSKAISRIYDKCDSLITEKYLSLFNIAL